MKTLTLIFAAIALLGTVSHSDEPDGPVSLDYFYDSLEPYGNWREVGDYGYCWQPRDVEEGWSPYTDGRWLYTDAGWTWDTDEPYGWAVYHYGRWADVQDVGWVWIPDTEWGPGWVSWRHSPEYVGWAPLPPEARFLRALGLSVWVDDYYDIGPRSYHFIQGRDFGSRHRHSGYIDQRQNLTIIQQTTNITNITYVNNMVHNGGLRYDQQSRQSSAPIGRYTLDRRSRSPGDPRDQSGDHFRSRINGDSLSMMAPSFVHKGSSAPKRLGDKVNRVEVNRGWRDAGNASEVAATRDKMKSTVRVPDALPKRPQFQRPQVDQNPTPDRPRTQPPGGREDSQKGKGKGKPDRADTPPNPNQPPSRPEPRPEMKDRPRTQPPTERGDSPKGKGKGKPDGADTPRNPNQPPSRPEPRPEMKDRPPAPKDRVMKPDQNKKPTPRPDAPAAKTPQRPDKPKESTKRPEQPKPEIRRPEMVKPTPEKPSAPRVEKKPAERPRATPKPPAAKRPEVRKPAPRPPAARAPQTAKPKGKPAPNDKKKPKDEPK